MNSELFRCKIKADYRNVPPIQKTEQPAAVYHEKVQSSSHITKHLPDAISHKVSILSCNSAELKMPNPTIEWSRDPVDTPTISPATNCLIATGGADNAA